MIEYLYDCIRASADKDIIITAKITDDAGEVVGGCSLMLHDDEKLLTMVEGIYEDGIYQFNVPATDIMGLKGRYWYCICDNYHRNLCFKQPIYLV